MIKSKRKLIIFGDVVIICVYIGKLKVVVMTQKSLFKYRESLNFTEKKN